MNAQNSNYLPDPHFLFGKAGIKEKEKVADLGCGTSGYFIFPAAKLVGGTGIVYAVDVNKQALEMINKRAEKENYNNIKTVWTDLEKFKATNIETESLDVALLVNTLFQSSQRAAMLRESIRMLKKNGRLIIAEWKNTHTPLGPPLENRVDPENLKQAAQKLGLKLEKDFNAAEYHYGLLFTKL